MTNVIVAPETTAPVGSVNVPTMPPLAAAQAAIAHAASITLAPTLNHRLDMTVLMPRILSLAFRRRLFWYSSQSLTGLNENEFHFQNAREVASVL